MIVDLTLPITPSMWDGSLGGHHGAPAGHIGTHFDTMNKTFPLDFLQREGVAFDVSAVRGRDIDSADVAMEMVKSGMFVAFYTGHMERVGYGTDAYFSAHPQLSDELIDRLLTKGVSIIGIDTAGVRRGKEHTPKDRYCAEHGTFIVENLCGLQTLVQRSKRCTMYTFPLPLTDVTGCPCRVVAVTE